MWRPRWSGRYDLPVPRPHPQSVAARQRRASRPIFLLGVESARAVTLASPLVGTEEEDAMSEHDDYIPSMNIDNTAPPRICAECGRAIYGIFYVSGQHILCKRCRP